MNNLRHTTDTSLKNIPATGSPPANSSVSISACQTTHSKLSRHTEKTGVIALLKDCLRSLLRRPPKTNILLLALMLAVPAMMAIFSPAFSIAGKNLLDSRHVTVFLTDVSTSEALQLTQALANNNQIITAALRPVDLQAKQVLTIELQPAATLGPAQVSFIVDELTSHTAVDYVAADQRWLDRNLAAINIAKNLRWISIIVAALATAALVYRLIHADLLGQKPELRVLYQLGASHTTLLPSLVLRGVLLTLLAAAGGILLAWTIAAGLVHYVDISTYGAFLPDSFPVLHVLALFLIALFSCVMTVRFCALNP